MGFTIKGKEHLVLRLRRAIYGLKQAARVWWIELDRSLKKFGFKRLYADAGIFIAQLPNSTLIFLLAYIEFVCMRIRNKDGQILLDQTDYLRRIITRFGMTDAKIAKTPLPTGYKPEPFIGTSTPQLRSQYQSLIGSLLYLMLGT